MSIAYLPGLEPRRAARAALSLDPLPGPARRVWLVSCSAMKRSQPAEARSLYTSPLFRKSRALVERTGDPWLILSAEHGVVHPNRVLAPYDTTLSKMPKKDRLAWGRNVAAQLAQIHEITPETELIALAGAAYLDPMRAAGVKVSDPLAGQQIGERLHSLSESLSDSGSRTRFAHAITTTLAPRTRKKEP